MADCRLIACGTCARHICTKDAVCRHCGAAVPAASGRSMQTAAAVALGLGLVAGASACSSAQNEYGAPVTTTVGQGGAGGAGGEGVGGEGGAGGEGVGGEGVAGGGGADDD